MTQEHPITPPPEIVREWQIKIEYCSKRADREAIVAKLFQLGADMELEACCEWLKGTAHIGIDFELLHARRPKSPSLKELALAALNIIEDKMLGPTTEEKLIRRALESLPS
jgi:hypothetical protein